MKRLSVKEVDRFIEKLKLAEVSGDMARYRENAVTYLNLFCREIAYRDKKSVSILELKEP